MRARSYFVYILASHSRTLYIGVTRDLPRRLHQHRSGAVPGFSSRYRTWRLVYFEETRSVHSAIAREKELKGWRREKKIRLIESTNAGWMDLSPSPVIPKERTNPVVIPKERTDPVVIPKERTDPVVIPKEQRD